MFSRLESLFQPKAKVTDPYEQFVMAFVEECRRQGRKPSRYDHEKRTFFIDDGRGSAVAIQLENGFRDWREHDEAERSRRLARFVRGVFEAAAAQQEAPPLAELMPGVRSRALISNMLIGSGATGPTGNAAEIAWAPVCGELAAIVNHDRPDTLRPLTRRVFEGGTFSFDEAMTQTIANLRAKVPAPDFQRPFDVPGLFFCNNLEDFQSSLLLLTPGVDFRFPTLRGDPVVLVPSRNQLFVTGSENPLGLDTLIKLADTARELPHFLSSGLFVWRDGRWNTFAPESGTGRAAKQRLIALRDLGSDYREQKAQLDQLHDEQKAEIVVSEFMAFQPQPEAEFSITFVDSGTKETLLPKTDRIRFVDADQMEETLDVAWDDAMAIAGTLFEPVPALYPERHRLRGFPTAEMRAELKKKAIT
jgi:hypothetical protein